MNVEELISLLHVELHGARYEHQFWLQIMGDHSRFIHNTLYPIEKVDLQTSEQFIRLFDDLLEQARSPLDATELWSLNHSAYQATVHLRAFKLNLLDRSLLGMIKIGISPSFLNHMVNELDEYVRILQELLAGRPVPQYPPLHYDLVWLTDAAFHSATIAKNLDFAERQLIAISSGFEHHFNEFYLKAIELAGYLRTMRKEYPVFARFHQDINLEMGLFMNFLKELKELDLSNELLSSMTPLLPDHLFREECYYLNKLAQLGEIPMKECNPTAHRVDR